MTWLAGDVSSRVGGYHCRVIGPLLQYIGTWLIIMTNTVSDTKRRVIISSVCQNDISCPVNLWIENQLRSWCNDGVSLLPNRALGWVSMFGVGSHGYFGSTPGLNQLGHGFLLPITLITPSPPPLEGMYHILYQELSSTLDN